MAAETVAVLRELVADTEADGGRAASLVDHLQGRRRALLLAGDDAALSRLEAELLKAERDRERARLKLEELGRRLAAAEAAELRTKAQAERGTTAALIREKLAIDRKLDQALATVDSLAARRRELDATVRRRWLTHMDELGPYAAEFLHDFLALRSAVPPALARELGVAAGLGKPLVEGDVALHALARLEGEAQPQPAPVRADEPAGPSITIGAVPPPRPETPDELGRLRRLFAPPTPRDPLAPPPRRV